MRKTHQLAEKASFEAFINPQENASRDTDDEFSLTKRDEKMLEHMLQGIAYAGGIEVPPGRSILPPRRTTRRRPGPLRRLTAHALAASATRLCAWSARLMEPCGERRATA
jgi:hypothetical protein